MSPSPIGAVPPPSRTPMLRLYTGRPSWRISTAMPGVLRPSTSPRRASSSFAGGASSEKANAAGAEKRASAPAPSRPGRSRREIILVASPSGAVPAADGGILPPSALGDQGPGAEKSAEPTVRDDERPYLNRKHRKGVEWTDGPRCL